MRLIILASTVALASCQSYGDESAVSAPAATPQSQTTSQGEIPLLVSATCAGCHAVEPDTVSPLADTASFVDIANRDGLTKATLTRYLSDAHNYPDQMDVEVDAADIEVIADYMLSLRTPNYKRRPS